MSFKVNLWSFSKEANSTAQPTGSGTEYNCVTNDDLDVLNPRVPLNIGNAANPTSYNYMKIADFGRFYWIRTWKFEAGLWTAYCEVDPLASWKTQIGSTSAYVLRAAAASNGAIVDHKYPTKASPTVSKTAITAPWSASDLSYDAGAFIVGVINKNGATEYYRMSPSVFKNFCQAAFDDNFFNGVKDQTWLTKAIFDPMQYLSSVTWFPYVSGGGIAESVFLGYWSTGIHAIDINDSSIGSYHIYGPYTVTLPKHPQAATRGTYLNSAPYSSYMLDLRPFGRIALDSAALAGESTIDLTLVVDHITGSSILRITRGSDGTPLAMQQAQIGVSVQVSQVLRDYFTGGMNMAQNLVNTVGNALIGNIPGAINSGLSAVGNAVETMQPDVTTSGLNGGFAALYGDWYLVSTFYSLVNEDNTHSGRPLCEVRTLSTLSGYQLCTNVDVSIPATREEIDMIRGYLESGYYYE